MRVLIVGDVHGQHQRLAESLRQAQANFRITAAIQVGDFGFYRDQMEHTRMDGVRFPVPLHVIDGNHEDHQWLRHALRLGLERIWKNELNLIYQPRPSVARFGSSKVGFLGGALHVDRPQRHNWLGGFPNYILRRHREHAATLFNQQQPELIITHSCPSRIGIGIVGVPELQAAVTEHITAAGFDPGPREDCGEVELGRLWLDLAYRPRAWVFGHFHRAHNAVIESTRFVCVGDDLDSSARPLVIWDTEEKKLLLCPADPSLLSP
ncbi:MAG TPA: metallophosphoesterase [Candidatus Paceibacterota bacterium]|nr:metallophosphoesterase [Verrucomicrobiota bacterium]HRY49171.1 metallophosphoesterase [Candidatus Paceibacterota bacterium]HSA02619.1 metallophosphoesterase [Candidatus Paceibacterota bacterium]